MLNTVNTFVTISVFNVPRLSFNFRSLFWVLGPNDEINVDVRLLFLTGFILFALACKLSSSFLSHFLFESCALDQTVPLIFDLLFAETVLQRNSRNAIYWVEQLFFGKMFFFSLYVLSTFILHKTAQLILFLIENDLLTKESRVACTVLSCAMNYKC